MSLFEMIDHDREMRSKFKEFMKGLQTTPPVECDFCIGDEVTFTNEYGVSWSGFKIIGFAKDDSFYGRFIHLDKENYWFPVTPESLELTTMVYPKEKVTYAPV